MALKQGSSQKTPDSNTEKKAARGPQPGRVVASDKNTLTILCASGSISKIKMPVGPLGTKHFALMTKYSPVESDYVYIWRNVQVYDREEGKPVFVLNDDGSEKTDEFGNFVPVLEKKRIPIPTESLMEKLIESYTVWASEVLPHIIIDGPSYDEMLGEDQFGIYMAVQSQMNTDDSFFRILDDKDIGGEGGGMEQDEQMEGCTEDSL